MSENISKITNKKAYFYKGKRVTQKMYEKRLRDKNRGQDLVNYRKTFNSNLAEVTKSVDENDDFDGRRIVHLKTLQKEMFCIKCKAPLHLKDLVEEDRHGLASVFWFKCTNIDCNGLTSVNTDKQHKSVLTNKNVYDINTKAAAGRRL